MSSYRQIWCIGSNDGPVWLISYLLSILKPDVARNQIKLSKLLDTLPVLLSALEQL